MLARGLSDDWTTLESASGIASPSSATMMYNIYIYNRKGVCLFYHEWQKDRKRPDDDPEFDAERNRLVYGMIFSLDDTVMRMATPRPTDGMLSIKTNAITMHMYLTLTGFRFIITTDSKAGDLRPNLQHIYSNLFVEYVITSPIHDPKSDRPIDSPLFEKHLNAYVEELSCFR